MYSVGTDIVKIDRIGKLARNNKFLSKIFTDKEIKYCNLYSKPYIHLSGKYAAKEAIKKALLSKSLIERISLKKIEILNKEDKSPYVLIHGIHDFKCMISISHDEEYAIAFALIEK